MKTTSGSSDRLGSNFCDPIIAQLVWLCIKRTGCIIQNIVRKSISKEAKEFKKRPLRSWKFLIIVSDTAQWEWCQNGSTG